jgi:acetyl esterase
MQSMPIHLVIAHALATTADQLPSSEMPIAEARAQAMLSYVCALSTIPVQSVYDTEFTGPAEAARVRVYKPLGIGPHPFVLYFHGGGFVVLELDSHDELCRRLCVGSPTVVISVCYRLAPEHGGSRGNKRPQVDHDVDRL